MKRLINLINTIKNGYASHQEVVYSRRGKMVEPVLKMLTSANFIRFFKLVDRGYNIHLNRAQSISNIKVVAKGGGIRCENKINLQKYFCKKGRYALITTDKGMKWSYECIRDNIGGKPLLYIEQ